MLACDGRLTQTILPVIAVATALAFAGCGDDEGSGDARPAASGNAVDRAFVADMIPHHEAALQMAKVAQRRASSPFVKGLADDILRTQAAEIESMRAAGRAASQRGRGAGLARRRAGPDGDGPRHEDTAQQREISAMRKQLAKDGAAPMDDMDAAHGSGHSE